MAGLVRNNAVKRFLAEVRLPTALLMAAAIEYE